MDIQRNNNNDKNNLSDELQRINDLDSVFVWKTHLMCHHLWNSSKHNLVYKILFHFFVIVHLISIFLYVILFLPLRVMYGLLSIELAITYVFWMIFVVIPVSTYVVCMICAIWYQYLVSKQLSLQLKQFEMKNNNNSNVSIHFDYDCKQMEKNSSSTDTNCNNMYGDKNSKNKPISDNINSDTIDCQNISDWFYDIYKNNWLVSKKNILRSFGVGYIFSFIYVWSTYWYLLSRIFDSSGIGHENTTYAWTIPGMLWNILPFGIMIIIGCQCTYEYRCIKSTINRILMSDNRRNDSHFWECVSRCKNGIYTFSLTFKIYMYDVSWERVMRVFVFFTLSKVFAEVIESTYFE